MKKNFWGTPKYSGNKSSWNNNKSSIINNNVRIKAVSKNFFSLIKLLLDQIRIAVNSRIAAENAHKIIPAFDIIPRYMGEFVKAAGSARNILIFIS